MAITPEVRAQRDVFETELTDLIKRFKAQGIASLPQISAWLTISAMTMAEALQITAEEMCDFVVAFYNQPHPTAN